MNCSNLFNSEIDDEDSLHKRTKLSTLILAKGISKKDELIEFLRIELKEAFECEVRFWLQGSYKSHTLIKPVDKFSSYDIDVGVYLFFDAEVEGIDSRDVKNTLKDALISYCNINDEAKLQESKNACEGLEFSTFLTIDTPIYYISGSNIKLATDGGWVDSDPMAIQGWLTEYYSDKDDRALMKRLVRYFKAWINVKWQGTRFKKIPSLVVNILVAQHMNRCEREDDSFLYTALGICEVLEANFFVKNPLNENNLIDMSKESRDFAIQNLEQLKRLCQKCIDASEFEKGVEFSNIFQHYFPQIKLETTEAKLQGKIMNVF